MIHPLDLIGDVAAQIMHHDGRIGVIRQKIGQAQRHHHRRQTCLHIQRAVPPNVVCATGNFGERVARPRPVVNENYCLIAISHCQQRPRRLGVAGVRIFSGMRDRWMDVHIVAATKDSQTEYWVAATQREGAVAAVQRLLAPGWTATLSADRRISPAQVAVLHLRPNGVRKLIPILHQNDLTM